jgi:hypothetical protein
LSRPYLGVLAVSAVLLSFNHVQAAPLNAYQAAVLADSPRAYYPFEELSKANTDPVEDATVNSLDGSYGTGIAAAQGPHGIGDGTLPNSLALDFRNTTSMVTGNTLGNFGSTMGDADGFSVALWVNAGVSSTIQQPLGRLELNDQTALAIDFNRVRNGGAAASGTTAFYLRDAAGRVLSQDFSSTGGNLNLYDGKWHYLVFSVEDAKTNQMKIFVDGQQQTILGSTSNLIAGSTFSNFALGPGIGAANNRNLGPANPYSGYLDEVAFIPTALSGAQIQAQINSLPTYRASYDGTYAPTDTAPPLTQTTWQQVTTGGTTITRNTQGPAATPGTLLGYAHFNDTTTGGRTSIFTTFSPTEQLELKPWAYETRLRIDQYSDNVTFVGVRDEGGDGKQVLLSWNPTNGALSLYNANTTVVQLVNSSNFIDGQFHVYRVEKLVGSNGFEVQVYVDGVAQFVTPLNYSALFPNDLDGTNGIGYFSPTPGIADVTMDYLSFTIIPEPSSAVLLVLGVAAVLRWRRRRV